MCNDYERYVEWERYCAAMAEAELGMPADAGADQLPQAGDVRVRDTAPVMRVAGNAVELVAMTWGFPPQRRGGAPVFNFRSEGRRFAESKRCLIPASAFFEFTGSKTPKSKWRFTLAASPVIAITGLWRDGTNGDPPSFTMLTTPPGPDIEPYHDRQIVVLPPRRWAEWLYLTRAESEMLTSLPAGSFHVEPA